MGCLEKSNLPTMLKGIVQQFVFSAHLTGYPIDWNCTAIRVVLKGR